MLNYLVRPLLLSALIFSTAQFSTAEPLKITTTTEMIGDLARTIGGDAVAVTALMGPGVDPHLYKASQGDLERLRGADLILHNGLHLEGKMSDIFSKLSRSMSVYAVSDRIPENLLRSPPEFEGQHDPHIWFDVSLWKHVAQRVTELISEKIPGKKAEIEARGAQYGRELDTLHEWIKSQVAAIPQPQRVLITAHDAFGYFGRAYSIEVLGLQGISTATEFGLHDLKKITDVILTRKIKAVFIESSVPQRFVNALVEGVTARGGTVKIGGELFSDSMGPSGTPESTYQGMIRHNVNLIVGALKE